MDDDKVEGRIGGEQHTAEKHPMGMRLLYHGDPLGDALARPDGADAGDGGSGSC